MSSVSKHLARQHTLLRAIATSPTPRVMPVATSRQVSPPEDQPKAKRSKLSNDAIFLAESCGVDPVEEARLVAEEMNLPLEYAKSYNKELNYRDKLVLAPMVRTGSLPMRLLSLHYGAGLVWSPEVVDKAIIGAQRTVDPATGVITYHKGQGPIFSTHPVEKPYLVFQIGSSDPELAVKAALTVQQDVAGIDLNCGCPKPFSTHSGMGAALLSTPDILLNILRALLDKISLPISCKIRLLPEQPSTLYLVSRILRTGIRNLTVHCRTRSMRSGERALWERLGDIVELGRQRGLPIICNGDSEGWGNWETIRTQTGANSVMIARAAERNPSIFLPTGAVCNLTQVIPKLLSIADYTSNPWGNTKFLLTQFKPSGPPISNLSKFAKKEASEVISKSKTLEQVAQGLGIELRGREVFEEIVTSIRVRNDGNIWEERREAEQTGQVLDEAAPAEIPNHDDGFEVGTGLTIVTE